MKQLESVGALQEKSVQKINSSSSSSSSSTASSTASTTASTTASSTASSASFSLSSSSSLTSVSLSSTSIGLKRGHSSPTSSSTSSAPSKRQKIQKIQQKEHTEQTEKKEQQKEHPGIWLFEEALEAFYGMNHKGRDKRKGMVMLQASAMCGYPLAISCCHAQGWNGCQKDYKYGFELMVECEKKDHDEWSQYYLGVFLQYGDGVEQNYNLSMEWFCKSAEQGNCLAMNKIGCMYNDGNGCILNKNIAFTWFSKSAKKGYSTAMCNLAVYYKNGEVIPQDLKKAREWYTQAIAGLGEENALEQLKELKGGRDYIED